VVFSPIVLKPSVQEYVWQVCPFKAVQDILPIYLLHDRISSWKMPLHGRQKITLISETHVITVYPQTLRWKFYQRRVGTICWRTTFMVAYIHFDTTVQRAKEARLILKILKNRRHEWIRHTIRHNEFVVNVLERAIPGKKAVGRPRLQYLKQLPDTQELTIIQQWKEWLATNPDGKLPTNQKAEG
jgi:hypothetical protein